jgi:hypothetical protein
VDVPQPWPTPSYSTPTLAQNYAHHLEAELVERGKQLEVNQVQVEELQDVVHHKQELLPQDEEPEEVEGVSGAVVHHLAN